MTATGTLQNAVGLGLTDTVCVSTAQVGETVHHVHRATTRQVIGMYLILTTVKVLSYVVIICELANFIVLKSVVGCDCELCGIEDEFQPCDPVTKECICKANVEGDRCDRCKSGFHSLTFSNPNGCEECACDYAGAAALPCNATTKECYCREGFTGTTCDVEPGLYVPLLEEIFFIRNIDSNLDTPTYLLIAAGVISGRGWRVSSTDSFYTQFSVEESGDYLFFPLITASSPDSMVVITLTSDSSESISYTIPATNLSRWNVVLFLNSEFIYTVSVEHSSTGDLLVVEELLFLPLESTSISYDRLELESVYSECIPYSMRTSVECGLAKELSISITQSPLG